MKAEIVAGQKMMGWAEGECCAIAKSKALKEATIVRKKCLDRSSSRFARPYMYKYSPCGFHMQSIEGYEHVLIITVKLTARVEAREVPIMAKR